MSRNVFRLHHPVNRPTLSWSTAPQARESLVALTHSLTHWLLGGNKAEVVQIAAVTNDAADLAFTNSQNPELVQGELAALAPVVPRVEPKARQPHLKVVMVRDAQNPLAPSPGRLVISGRMADVCAELDRLAA